ncbi:hypothetical protein CY34DRAFT_401109 [Suillus luteus UH-Slu-Lm8-n1]|uniref:Uncharacterized protein n=1 Tax=Suillus luteus UH-Slu-Lm8-n1 TaxID=930992 RepID=A0A0D0BTZ8_9AGAM|nr:hypothetical protein CY34DRAFT_401109 [Suillus luteus UH-Slu-Lm8-n1]
MAWSVLDPSYPTSNVKQRVGRRVVFFFGSYHDAFRSMSSRLPHTRRACGIKPSNVSGRCIRLSVICICIWIHYLSLLLTARRNILLHFMLSFFLSRNPVLPAGIFNLQSYFDGSLSAAHPILCALAGSTTLVPLHRYIPWLADRIVKQRYQIGRVGILSPYHICHPSSFPLLCSRSSMRPRDYLLCLEDV